MDEINLSDEQHYYMKYTTNDSPKATRYIPIIADGETHARFDPNKSASFVDVNENVAPSSGNGVDIRGGAHKRLAKKKGVLRENYDQLVASFTSSG